ncbi:MAG TPA: AMP-binding protein [Steroidobacteraceae bacterium]|nr:AMP-binding protein [Steroidobacteraceae bacterium]
MPTQSAFAETFEAEPALGMDRKALETLQLERLRWSIRHAYDHNACYRRKLDACGVSPGDLRALADLARFPFTRKQDLRAAYPYDFFAVPLEDIVRLHASSGTTGKPTLVGYTAQDIALWSRLVARSIRAAGGRRGMKIHVAYGYGLFTGGLGAHYGAEAAGCTVIPASGGQTARQVQLITDLRPDIIMVTPSYMLALLDEFRRQAIDPASSSLRIGIFGAEPWGEGIRQEIERAFGLDACDIYGLSEVMGPGIAQEFGGTREGPTLWEDHFLAEIVDAQSGEVLAEGERGELVLTSLTKQAMPVIRYRTGDLTRLLPGRVTALRRLARITGRTDDMLIVRGVNVFPSQIEELILESPRLAPHYQIEISRPQRMDEMRVRVEARGALAQHECRAEGAALAQRLKALVGICAEFEVVASGSLPRSSGKATRVTDLRAPR